MRQRTPGPSLVVAALVLSLAAGGVGFAAGSLPKHRVRRAQLKKNAVTAKKIKPGSVTRASVKDGGLTGADLATGTVTGAKVAPDSLGGAQIDESSLSVPVKPGSILLTGYDFRPTGSSYDFVFDGLGSIHTVANTGVFSARIDVPPGANVTGLKVFVVDTGPSSVDVYVDRFVPSSAANLYSGKVSSSGAVNALQTLTMSPLPLVAGSTQDLEVLLPAGSAYKLFGAQIDYQ